MPRSEALETSLITNLEVVLKRDTFNEHLHLTLAASVRNRIETFLIQ